MYCGWIRNPSRTTKKPWKDSIPQRKYQQRMASHGFKVVPDFVHPQYVPWARSNAQHARPPKWRWVCLESKLRSSEALKTSNPKPDAKLRSEESSEFQPWRGLRGSLLEDLDWFTLLFTIDQGHLFYQHDTYAYAQKGILAHLVFPTRQAGDVQSHQDRNIGAPCWVYNYPFNITQQESRLELTSTKCWEIQRPLPI